VPKVHELGNWVRETHRFDVHVAANLGFPVGDVTTDFKEQAVILDSSRWKDVTTGEQTYRFGVALRAMVVVADMKISGGLTLPMIAAKVEIEGARARAQLLVRGYTGGKLGKALPNWQSFGVDSYVQYMKSISEIEKLILADEDNIQPELLATTVLSADAPTAAAAVGTVYGLHEIAECNTLNRAIRKLTGADENVRAALRAVYEQRVGTDETARPSAEQAQAARHELFGIHVSA
jgi:hypothetical protein